MKFTTKLTMALASVAVVVMLGTAGSFARLDSSVQDGSVVNKSGIVRGATQRAVKLELVGQPQDELLGRISNIIDGLTDGSEELNLPAAADPTFTAAIDAIRTEFDVLVELIRQYRGDPSLEGRLIEDSETFFGLTNDAVFAAETIASDNVAGSKRLQIVVAGGVLIVLALAYVLTFRIARRVRANALRISATSQQLEAAVAEQSQVLESQAAITQLVASTAAGAGGLTRAGAGLASGAREQLSDALDLARDGSDALERATAGMMNTREHITAVNECVDDLRTRADQIADVSGLVADIAEQINMLALNASIEAARAGEHGKGFSVVAGEVRELADQTAASAAQIGELTSEVRDALGRTVGASGLVASTADEGIAITSDTRDLFQTIRNAVETLATCSIEMVDKTSKGASAMDDTVEKIERVSDASRSTAAAVQQIHDSSLELESCARELSHMM